MKYINIEVTAKDKAGISKDQSTEFFKLYVKLSKKVKKFVGCKSCSTSVPANFEKMLEAMRELVKEDV